MSAISRNKQFFIVLLVLLAGVVPAMFAQEQVAGAGQSGLFSIAQDRVVVFSQGNLQCKKNSNGSYDWRFADNQYDRLKGNNNNTGKNGVWFDLFGYGTSNFTYGRTTFKPEETSRNGQQSKINGFWEYAMYLVKLWVGGIDYPGSNLRYVNLDSVYFEDNMDWGLNEISANGQTLPAGTWATLTQAEWDYVLNQRQNADSLRYMYTIVVNGENIQGLLLLPDGRTDLDNTMAWSLLEQEGAIFLPCAGMRHYKEYRNYKDHEYISSDTYFKGYYWSSTCSGTTANYLLAKWDAPYSVHFDENGSVLLDHQFVTIYGMSVRLAREINIPIIFNYADGSENDTLYVMYGDPLPAAPRTPTGYTTTCCYNRFSGWKLRTGTRVFMSVTDTAQYSSEPDSYSVVYKNWDGTTLDSTIVQCNMQGSSYYPVITPSYNGTPSRNSDECRIYTFAGWDPEVAENVTEDAVYTAVYDTMAVTYEVTFLDYDGDSLCYYPALPCDSVPTCEEPSRAATAEYSYTFKGWKETPVANANATYIAQYDSIHNKYEITWYNYDSTVLRKDSIIYDTMPVYTGLTPVKDATLKFTYLFLNQWNPAIQPVKKDTGYVAVFDSLLNSYKIVWKNWNDTILHTSTHNYGDTIIAPADPVRTTETDSAYFFIGWMPDPVTEVSHVNGIDTMFVAQYHSIPRYYDVTYIYRDKNESGEWDTLTTSHQFGDILAPDSLTSEKWYCDSTHIFLGWNPALESVNDTSAKTFTAVYSDTLNLYAMTWIDSAGTHTYRQPYDSLLMVQQTADTVISGQDIWIFTGWQPAPASLGNKVPCQDTTFKATYRSIPRYYDVTYIYRDEAVSGQWDTLTTTHQFGDALTPDSFEVERWYCDSTHLFTGWDPVLEQVNDTSEKVFVAQYLDTANVYNIVWKNWNDTILHLDRLEYQDAIIAPADPVRITDATNVYFFDGWNPNPVTQLNYTPCEDTVFRALYTSAPRYYDVTVVLEDSTTHIVGEYDSLPNLSQFETTFVHYDSTYTFNHWSPAVHSQDTVVDTYTAVYTVTVNKYYITWADYDDSELRTDTLECGQMPSYSPDPTRVSDCDYDYSFNAWTPAITAVTQNATYKATYSSTLRDYYITWKNWNDTVLRIDTLNCSAMPTYTLNPYKPGDSQIAYKFTNWSPVVAAVSGDAEYIAQYDSAETYVVTDSILYLECVGTLITMPDGSIFNAQRDTVLVIHKHFNVIPFPETGDILDCDSVFTVDVRVYKKPMIDISTISCPEAIFGLPLLLDKTTSEILSYFGVENDDQITVASSRWEIYENRKWAPYDGHRILSEDNIKLRFVIETEPCGDVFQFDYPSNRCDLIVQDANADNCEDCNDVDCVDALYDWLLIFKNKYMRDSLGYDVPPICVTWYKVVGDKDDLREPEECDDERVGAGYYLTIEQNFHGTGDYYALVDVRNCHPDTLPCRGIMRSQVFYYQGADRLPSVNLIPTETKPQGLITISGLDPMQKSQIYVYDMAGRLMIHDAIMAESYDFIADGPAGVYRVLVLSNNMKETSTFIIK